MGRRKRRQAAALEQTCEEDNADPSRVGEFVFLSCSIPGLTAWAELRNAFDVHPPAIAGGTDKTPRFDSTRCARNALSTKQDSYAFAVGVTCDDIGIAVFFNVAEREASGSSGCSE
jgi:hypothetical protein